MRLAKDMGALDVREVLQRITPEQFDVWWAANLTGKLDDNWAQAAMVCAVMVNAIREIGAGLAGVNLKESDLMRPSDFMPTIDSAKDERELPAEDPSVSNLNALLAARFKGAEWQQSEA